jgi:hypothetical protein
MIHGYKINQIKSDELLRMRTFGCLAWAHIDLPTKLSPRARKCIMLGYPKEERGYRLWNLEQKCIILSLDVTFKENVFPMAENKKVDQFGVFEMSKNQTENHCHTVNTDIGSDGYSEVLSSFDSNSNDGSQLGSSDESHDESACKVEDEDES